jgi:predicted Zn-dependent protease
METAGAQPQPGLPAAVFFDGHSSQRHVVTLSIGDRLIIAAGGSELASWNYAAIRRADGRPGILRLRNTEAPALARLEIRDEALAGQLLARCPQAEAAAERRGYGAIVGWSLAAAASIMAVVIFGLPMIADRLAPLIPAALERRLGDVAEKQTRAIFGGKACEGAAGQEALAALVGRLGDAAGLTGPIEASVLKTSIPNAFALPGGKVVVLRGLLDKAQDADELAGVLAHELGHLDHRDSLRHVIHAGGTSFLIGLLFGDMSGSGALVIASRSLVDASYSREVEEGADSFAITTMHRLGRSPRGMGELMFRITGSQKKDRLSILASHPLTDDRLNRVRAEDGPASAPPLLTAAQWAALKAICD